MSADIQTIPDDIIVKAGEVCNDLGISSSVANCEPIMRALFAERPSVQPIETAPDLERVMVCGWNAATKRVQGYWWWHEDVVHGGKSLGYPHATHWFPIVKPVFPAAPKSEG